MTELNEVDFAKEGLEALLYIISAFSFVFSFNVILNELYFSEDIDNILSLPVKPETLVASKFTSCFVVENVILYVFLVLGIIAYVTSLGLPIWNLILSIIGIIVLPIIPMVLCTLIVLALIYLFKRFLNSKSIKKITYGLVAVLVFISFYILWKLSSFNFQEYIENFAAGDHTFLNVMKFIFPQVRFFVEGLNDGSIIHMLLSVIISIVYFIAMVFVAKGLYYDGVVEIRNKDTNSKKSSRKILKEAKIMKPEVSYFWKDLKMIFRSPTFFINCIIINIIWPIFIITIFKIALPTYTIDFMRNEIATQNPVFSMRMLLVLLGISILVTAFNSLASSAFSREGKNYQFIKYIPMKYGLQWRVKYVVSFVISFIGIIVYTLPFFIIIGLPILSILLNIVFIILCISFVSLIGLLIDSAFPKLIWDDEADSLRENYNTFIAMGYSLLLFTVLCGGGYYLIDHKSITNEQFTIATFVILLLGNLLLYLISRKKISRNIRNQESL
jgi:ABC-2 type transport system permease protein